MLAAFLDKNLIEAGCDEAGRGCLAGPVFAAAVILPKYFFHKDLNDSKQLSEKKRYILREVIEKEAIAYGVASASPLEIDNINILNASYLSMHRAVDILTIRPESLLIDGNRFRQYQDIPHHCIIKGDAKFLAIAAASVLAKTYRDDYMLDIHQQFPMYQWDKNKGYPAVAHRDAIRHYGSTQYHRMSFRLLPEAKQGKLFV